MPENDDTQKIQNLNALNLISKLLENSNESISTMKNRGDFDTDDIEILSNYIKLGLDNIIRNTLENTCTEQRNRKTNNINGTNVTCGTPWR